MFADLRTTWKYHPALNDAVIEQLESKLVIGDILLMRSEPKVTAALLPGFWSHSAIYIGQLDAIDRLELPNSESLQLQIAAIAPADRKKGLVLESIYAGVILRPLEQCLKADHVIALRPNIGSQQRTSVLQQAFSHFGKPYDFNFDFNVSSQLVCTELVYRSLHGCAPIQLDLTKRLGRYTLTADDLIDQLIDFDGDQDGASIIALALCNSIGQASFVASPDFKATLQSIRNGYRPARDTRVNSGALS